MVLEIISKVCSIFFIVGAGMAASKYRLIPEDGSAVLSKFLFNIVTPAMAITTMQGRVFAGQLANDSVWSFVSFTIVTLVIGVFSFFLVKPFRVSEADQGIYRMQLAFTNVGFMGIPVTTAVFGEMSGLLILLMNTPFIVLIYSYGVFLMLYRKGTCVFSRDLLKRIINIPLISSLLGVVILVAGFQLPPVLDSGLEMIADTMVPIGMFIVGIQLSKTNILHVLSGRNILLCVLSLVGIPLLTMGICLFLPQSDLVTATLVYAMAMPSGALCAVLAEEFQCNTQLASEGLALTTFFSLVTLPAWAIVLTCIYTI